MIQATMRRPTHHKLKHKLVEEREDEDEKE